MADELQCHKQTLFKIVKRLGLAPMKRRDIDRKNQLVATVTQSEALIIRQEFLNRARTNAGDSADEIGNLIADEGVFYLVRLEPEHDPGRIKLGFTTEVDGRLRKHRCSAPFAQCLKTWPCRRTWERAAIDCITAGFEQLHTEVFRAKSIEEAKKIVMPTVEKIKNESGHL
ncbi:MAG: hypothetical protein K2X81_12940, partial [Candidatus Obscuribacterales bacterium]|nr:hypothetical protein [Candidatus Obscuribacterales bacterium]